MWYFSFDTFINVILFIRHIHKCDTFHSTLFNVSHFFVNILCSQFSHGIYVSHWNMFTCQIFKIWNFFFFIEYGHMTYHWTQENKTKQIYHIRSFKNQNSDFHFWGQSGIWTLAVWWRALSIFDTSPYQLGQSADSRSGIS